MAKTSKKSKTTKKKTSKKTGKNRSEGMTAKQRKGLDSEQFAFPEQRKVPLNDASHVRNAVARFDQVKGVSAQARDKAWRRVKKAAKRMNVKVSKDSWRDLGRKRKKKSRKSKKS